MHKNFFILCWRRKLSVLLISSSLILICLWTWAFLYSSSNLATDGLIISDFIRSNQPVKHAYILQRLIAQANRLLRSEIRRQHRKDFGSSQSLKGIPLVVPAAAHSRTSLKNSAILRFVKPTKSPPFASSLPFKRKLHIPGETFLFEEERLRILENQQRVRNSIVEDLNNNNMDYERVLSSAERQTQYEHELQRIGVPVVAGIGPNGPPPPHERLVHLDLKGAPPKLSFLKRLLPVLKNLGATGLLIEYEDMFPYSGSLEALRAKNAYRADELRDFLDTAAMHSLSVMPLVQTFGHMEFVLKLQEFAHMREIAESPQAICPSKADAVTFVQQMLAQVIEFHSAAAAGVMEKNAKYVAPDILLNFTHIHIGCDEVERMGECEQCQQHTRHQLFLNHVMTLANFIRSNWPQLQVVIWDDMLRDMTLTELQHSQIGNYVEPMVWVYVNDLYHFVQPHLWDIYANVFPTAWAASAFKGAFGESLMIPPLQQHLENNIRWLAVIAKEGGRFSKGFKGIALTGWQRYDHFAVLCELLPISMPSLITSLSTVAKGHFITNPKENGILRVLDCAFHPDTRHSGHPWLELHANSHHSQLFLTCDYLGSLVYKYSMRLCHKLSEAENYLQQVHNRSAWMSDYNVRHNFTSPLRVQALTAHTPVLLTELIAMSREANELLYDIYDEHTIAEFVEQNIFPTVSSLNKHLQRGSSLQRHAWPQRPLPFAPELLELNMLPGNKTNQPPPSSH